MQQELQEHLHNNQLQSNRLELEKTPAAFTTVLKRTLVYHDLDKLVYEKRNRITVNRSNLTPPPQTKTKTHKTKSVKVQKSLIKQQKGKTKIQKLVPIKTKTKKITKEIRKKPKIKITGPKKTQIKQKINKEIEAQSIKAQNQQKEVVTVEQNKVDSSQNLIKQKHQKEVPIIKQQQVKAETTTAQQIPLVATTQHYVQPSPTQQRTQVKEMKQKELEEQEPLEVSGNQEENMKEEELQELEESPSSQSQFDQQVFKRVLRKREIRGGNNVLRDLQDYIQSESDNWATKKKPKKSKNSITGKYNVNRIFQRQKHSNNYSKFTLNVNLKDLDFVRFTELFGLFDLIMVTKSIRHFFSLDNITRLSRVGFMFFWIQTSELALGYHLLEKWGYDIVDQIVWIKTREDYSIEKKQGNLFNNSIQICLVGYKSLNKEYVQYKSKVSNNIIFADNENGNKPDQIYKICELMLPGGKRLNIGDNPHNGWLTLIDNSLTNCHFQTQKQISQSNQNKNQYEYQMVKGQGDQQFKVSGKYYVSEQFNLKCSGCRSVIGQICFRCLSCTKEGSQLCKGCFFGCQQRGLGVHLSSHRWQILRSAPKLNVLKGKVCFFCKKGMVNEAVYTCENCNNLYICMECKESGVENEGLHCHSKDHYLSLVI